MLFPCRPGWARPRLLPAPLGAWIALFLTSFLHHAAAHAAHMQTRLGAAEAAASATGARNPTEFLERVVKPMLALEGDHLPVRWAQLHLCINGSTH